MGFKLTVIVMRYSYLAAINVHTFMVWLSILIIQLSRECELTERSMST